jgi:sulfite exporter TauE/SafE
MKLAFFIGLLSSLHCFGMCGGVVGALTMSLHRDTRQKITTLFPYLLSYNIGRILSYSAAGLLAGLLGQSVITLMSETGGALLRLLFSFFVILLGLYVGGWFPKLALIERLGQPLWQRLQPIGVKYLPVKTLQHAFIFGVIWGWLPCGLVYYALVMAFAQQGVVDAGLFMFAFGVGTLLPMLLAGILTSQLVVLQRSIVFKQFNALVLIVIGVIGLWIILYPEIRHSLHYSRSF